MKYLRKHPLSTIREIADNYDEKRHNYRITKGDIDDLVKSGKIESVDEVPNCYYVVPEFVEFDRLLSVIKTSDKIYERKFKNLKFNDDNSTWSLPRLVRNLICLYHLRLKITTIEKKRSTRNRKAVLSDTEKKRLQRDYDRQIRAFGWEPAPTTVEECTRNLSEWAIMLYGNYEQRFSILCSNEHSTAKRFQIMGEKLTQNNYRDAADLTKTTTKNVRRLLAPLEKNGKFNWLNAYNLLEKEKGFGVQYDPYVVYLMYKSKARTKDIVDYLITVNNLYEISLEEYALLKENVKKMKSIFGKINLLDDENDKRVKQILGIL